MHATLESSSRTLSSNRRMASISSESEPKGEGVQTPTDWTVLDASCKYRLQKVIVPGAPLRSDGRGGFPVLLMHGLFQSAGSFITSEERSLAFWLAKEGSVYIRFLSLPFVAPQPCSPV